MHNPELERTLEDALTVGQMRMMLASFDEDMPMVFTSDFGDYHHTQQVHVAADVEEMDRSCFVKSAYSTSGFAFVDDGEVTNSPGVLVISS